MNWFSIFAACAAQVTSRERAQEKSVKSWCSWTTFRRLGEDAGYWTAELPSEGEFDSLGILDGGKWGQPFSFLDLAHLTIPRQYYWEKVDQNGFHCGTEEQDIDQLAEMLTREGINYRLTSLVLEIKLY